MDSNKSLKRIIYNKLNFALIISIILSGGLLSSCGGSDGNGNDSEPALDTTPNAFSFTDLQNQLTNTVVESNVIIITGINSHTRVTINNGEYKIGTGTYTSAAGTVAENETITVRHTTPASYQTTSQVTLTVGGISDVFDITTIAMSEIPLTVDVNLNVKHITGDVSEFDRSRFITMHSDIGDREWPSEQIQEDFFNDYDVYLGRNNGALPWQLSRLEATANNGVIDEQQAVTYGTEAKGWYKNASFAHYQENRAKNMMYGGQPIMYPIKENVLTCSTPCKGNDWIAGYEELAKYYSYFLSHYFGTGGNTGANKPKFIEVLNEPFVHSDDLNTTNKNIATLHKVVAQKLQQDHPDVLVGGYTAAFPQFEANNNNFAHWDNNWKTFIDEAGADSDFYSVHLYDGWDKGKDAYTYRVGSNSEAILDMIEHYSKIKVGEVKPWVISEYGFFARDITNGTPYSKWNDWLNIRSFSSIMMGLMEKPDKVLVSMPFTILKALWAGPDGLDANGFRYGPRMFVLEDELDGSINVADNGEWVYSEHVKFYQLWSDVKGTRVDSYATDPDLQVDSYVDGNTAYIILNNLEFEAKNITLNLNGGNTISAIESKHLFYDKANETPVLTVDDLAITTNMVTVDAESTMILKVTYANNVIINETSNEQKYYADKYKQSISANSAITFNINDIDVSDGNGEAILRLGLGRTHGKSLQPTLKINNTIVNVPEDFRGYDQKNRDSFFGVIEIPVPYTLLNTNNKVDVEFNDGGGFVTSMSLLVFEQSLAINRTGL